jgi:hypothetical protein
VKEQLELDKPKPPIQIGNQLVDPVTLKPVYTAPEKAPEAGSFGDYLASFAQSKGKTVAQLSPDLKRTAKAQWESAGRAPEKPVYEWATVNGENKLLTPAEIRAQGGTKPATGAAAENKFSTAAPVLEGIKELSERINTQQGLIAKMAGGAAKVAAQANYNDDVAEYEALVSGFTPLVARALGHTGVLTQQDVDSVKALFPTPGNSKTLRDRKITRVESIVKKLEGGSIGATGKPKTDADKPADLVWDPATKSFKKAGA